MVIVTCAQCGAKNRVDEKAKANGRQAVCGKCGAKLGTQGNADIDTGKPLTVTDATFVRDVLGAVTSRPVLLDCWAEWCGPCRMIAPILDQLAAESGGRYQVAKLNIDDNPQTAARFGIQSIPTMLIFKEGKLVDRIVGAHPKHAIIARLATHV